MNIKIKKTGLQFHTNLFFLYTLANNAAISSGVIT